MLQLHNMNSERISGEAKNQLKKSEKHLICGLAVFRSAPQDPTNGALKQILLDACRTRYPVGSDSGSGCDFCNTIVEEAFRGVSPTDVFNDDQCEQLDFLVTDHFVHMDFLKRNSATSLLERSGLDSVKASTGGSSLEETLAEKFQAYEYPPPRAPCWWQWCETVCLGGRRGKSKQFFDGLEVEQSDAVNSNCCTYIMSKLPAPKTPLEQKQERMQDLACRDAAAREDSSPNHHHNVVLEKWIEAGKCLHPDKPRPAEAIDPFDNRNCWAGGMPTEYAPSPWCMTHDTFCDAGS